MVNPGIGRYYYITRSRVNIDKKAPDALCRHYERSQVRFRAQAPTQSCQSVYSSEVTWSFTKNQVSIWTYCPLPIKNKRTALISTFGDAPRLLFLVDISNGYALTIAVISQWTVENSAVLYRVSQKCKHRLKGDYLAVSKATEESKSSYENTKTEIFLHKSGRHCARHSPDFLQFILD